MYGSLPTLKHGCRIHCLVRAPIACALPVDTHVPSGLQLGSTTLGRVNDEDAEKGLVWWDVFKVAALEGLKEKQLDEEALKPKNAKRLRVEHTINIAGKMPKSFQGHSPKELKLIAYVQVGCWAKGRGPCFWPARHSRPFVAGLSSC